MKKTIKAVIKLIIIFVIFYFLICGIVWGFKKVISHRFSLNTDSKYKVTLYSVVDGDGGSTYEEYYEIDLDEKTIVKRESYNCKTDMTVGKTFRRICKSYSGKIIAEGELSSSQVERLKKLFDNRISEGNAEEDDDETTLVFSLPYYVSSKDAKDIEMSSDESNEFGDIISASIEV